MFARALLAIAVSVWGFESPHHEAAFLRAGGEPEEVMGPNLNFSPISTSMKCILSLTIQYILIYTALGICRTVLDFQGVRHSDSAVATALKHGAETMFYAPMVCMMLIGFRMRVLQLTKGQGAPQEWVQFCMHSVTYAILANTLMVMLVPIVTKKPMEIEPTGEVKMEASAPFQDGTLQFIFNVIRYLTVLGLYVGFGGVVVGVFLFEPPAGVWDGPIPPVSPAVRCTVFLSLTFFLVYLCQAISRTYSQYIGGNTAMTTFETTMTRAADTLGMAPMLCALFLAARMRALQMDPISGNPQRWAQNCFFACTFALMAQTILAIAIPLCMKADVKEGKVEGDMEIKVDNYYLAKALTVARFLIMLFIYAGATAVVCSVFTIQHPDGDHLTPPLSPTMQCVLNLCFQYFLIYLLLWVFVTVDDFTGISFPKTKDAIESAKSTVQFAPMLAVLFIGTRLRALQMTSNQGAPQGWVQDGMYLATWSILIQFMMCLIMPFFTGHKYTPDALDGSQKPAEGDTIGNPIGAWAVTIVRYSALVALMGGVSTVAVGVYMMTPETANGRGAIPVIADGTLPVDLAPEPVGVNDIPGAKGAMKSVGGTVGSGVDAVDSGASSVSSGVSSVTG
jgi:hypothetical protein